MALKLLVNSFKPVQKQKVLKVTQFIPNPLLRQRHFFTVENVHEIPLVRIPLDVDKFKFLTIKVIKKEMGNRTCKKIIRGSGDVQFHGEILKAAKKELAPYELQASHDGGGYIKRNAKEKTIHIYGESTKYGQGNHEEVAKVLESRFPFYKITFEE